MEDTDFKYLWARRHDVLYRVQLSILYHQKRERFFEVCDKIGKAVAVIGGSAALSKIGAEAIPWIAAAITVTSTLSLVFGFSERSKRHAELARNFRQLEAEIVAKGERDFTEMDTADWSSKERLIETTEPPALGVLVTICQNELAIAQNQRDKIVPIDFGKRLLAHLYDF